MKSVLKKVQDQFWKNDMHTTDTANFEAWDATLVRDRQYVYFKDIRYDCQNTAVWDTLNHLKRIYYKLLFEGRDALHNENLMRDVMAALDYWLEKDFRNPNWWYNQIGMVSTLAALTLMLIDHLTTAQLARASELIKRGSVAGAHEILRWTGANLTWGIRDTIYHALITDDKELMKRASARIADEIVVTDGLAEGIKPDMSFYQHGQLLYSGGYGRSYTYETARLISILSGSEFSIAADKIALFEDFILDGQRYMTRGSKIDFQCSGREIARHDALSTAHFVTALELLLDTDSCRRKDELAAFHRALTTGEDSFSSTKYFPYSYFLSHNTADFHISVKGYHTDYKGSEWGLSENRLGYNLNYGGVTAFMASGREYVDLNPIADYSAIPGTTAPRWDEATLWDKSEGDWKSKTGTNDDCGGCTVGSCGLLYMRLEHDGISGYKTYFAFEDGIVCLGCALDGSETLYTTVDQAFLNGSLFAPRKLGCGESIVNGGFRYLNLSDAPMVAEGKRVVGAWSRNSPAESSDPVEGEIFLAQIDHSEYDTYAYAVLTKNATGDHIASFVNTPIEQSVTFANGRKLAVLRHDGETRIAISL